ncbi:MAG: hypothetical protein D6680_13810 [Cyanobacteria bacterium J007]|nr:MAG: hypothetical protein D6680_13810 [Cyanobacteria bacterium J007]
MFVLSQLPFPNRHFWIGVALGLMRSQTAPVRGIVRSLLPNWDPPRFEFLKKWATPTLTGFLPQKCRSRQHQQNRYFTWV